jgi:cysteine dioxygenase
MKKVSVNEFIEGLNSISQEDFSVENIFDYLAETPVDADSLNPYLHFSKKCYTRNLIYKNELFEVMALCWETGQFSRIHNHHEQKCWMSVPVGKLKGQNFRQLEIDESKGYCKIEAFDEFELHAEQPAKVEMDKPIHQILNLPEYKERAVSLHVYSKPFDRCLIYSVPKNEVCEVQLFYTSVFGELCDGVTL